MPAGSKMDPPLAKAEPISNGGNTSGLTALRRGKKSVQHKEQLQPERGVRRCERNNFADTQVSAEGGAGGAPGAGAEIPLQPMEKTMVRQAVPLQPMEVDGGADVHLQPMEDPTPEQGQSVRSPPPEEEGAAETPCDELTTTPIPHPSVPLGGGGREMESEGKSGKMGGVGGGV
ncbi:acid sphingomyelinase-like phosphodiesterase 3b [Grus japonensis]|uniref:Acid sphingomyelinase-like phosphodiesterase 3b n=1 Tax=Grus japonensis TaxID=30415 RepID=A0ABC9W953_GRUJA